MSNKSEHSKNSKKSPDSGWRSRLARVAEAVMAQIPAKAARAARAARRAARRAEGAIRSGAWAGLAAALLAACASPNNRAPVEERRVPSRPVAAAPEPVRSTAAAAAAGAAAEAASAPAKPPPGIENAGKPGYYTVKSGDTLIRIALDNGQNWRDVSRWNGLDNPNLIEVGQVLRVVAPGADPAAASTRAVAAAGRVESRGLDGKPAAGTAPAPASAVPAASTSASATAGSAAGTSSVPASGGAGATVSASGPGAPVGAAPTAARDGEEALEWAWPAAGTVAAGFDEAKSKGLAIVGKAGDPVYAAADGRVVYAGAGLRGYGNLVIVKHNATYLSAYAHNQTLLVKEEQAVRRGQKIAEMGNSDAERVQLHFEIRRLGKPIDPARLLPTR
jgi:lipoprotein NlpD